jgi:hypothetical protein
MTYLCTVMITTEFSVEAADWDAACDEARRVGEAAVGDVINVEVDDCTEDYWDESGPT